MAKNNLDLGSMFGELEKRASKPEERLDAPQAEPQPPIIPVASEQPSAVTPSPVVKSEDKQVLQGKQAKQGKAQKKEYNYGTKRTFPIPDELWDDALIVMQAQGLKQVEFIQGLIRDAVEANREIIDTVKRMRGDV